MRPASLSTFVLVTVAALPAYAGLGANGVQMNGVQMNGVQMNGVQMNGVQMNGVQMNGVQMNGVHLERLWLSGSMLQGTIVDANATTCSPLAEVDRRADVDLQPVHQGRRQERSVLRALPLGQDLRQ
jgi:hypothetical protein